MGQTDAVAELIRIDYCGIVENSARFLLYAFRTCDRFSLTFQTHKPYRNGTVEGIGKPAPELAEHLVNQHVTGDHFHKRISRGTVVNEYRCSSEARDILLGLGHAFELDPALPEDLCFYRGASVWLDSTTHERDAYLINNTLEDLKFVEAIGMKYWV